jgi:uncharacterized membrane protein
MTRQEYSEKIIYSILNEKFSKSLSMTINEALNLFIDYLNLNEFLKIKKFSQNSFSLFSKLPR